MIKIFVLTGIIGGIAITYLSVFALGPTSQLPPPESLLTGYRAQEAVPQSFNLLQDEAVDHDTFEVPEQDSVELAKAEEAMGDMAGMDMSGGGEAMEGMDMAEGETMADPDAPMEMAEGETMGEAPAAMDMAEGETMAAPDAPMVMAEGETMGEAPAAMDMDMAAPEEDPHDEDEVKVVGGLKITDEGDFDREIDLRMNEWGFSDMNIEVVKGERIRFNIANDGEILHEFMFMEMAAMQAVAYRVNRADWSLLEHEALYEKALVLPDGEFSVVLEIVDDGVWMFMCMLPYHMEMGMMGQMATAGNAMEM
ncbi:MAG: multicopper oxidase domain-containing protein [Devosiaceae bacterium]|nr:multicopper oxidase domain-containing protein [Devosiaceae bacterium]